MIYSGFATDLLQAYFTSKTVKALLVAGYTPAGEEFLADINALGVEVVDAGYTAGGVALTGVSYAWDDTDSTVRLHADDVTFGPFTGQPQIDWVIFYVDTGDPATSRLVAADAESGVPLAGQSVTYVVDDVGGLLQLVIPEAE